MFLNLKKGKSGFTLLELLVVIGIIAVLVGIGSVSYSTAQKKARDAKRKGDLQAIHKALEEYYSICGYQYPTPNENGFYNAVVCLTPSVAIMPTVPVDPKTITPYLCASTCDENQYQICTTLETNSQQFCVQNSQ